MRSVRIHGLLLFFFTLIDASTFAQKKSMTPAIQKLDATLREYNAPFMESILPPIDFMSYKDEVERIYGQKVNKSKVELLISIFSWVNGNNKERIFPFDWYFGSVEVCLDFLKNRNHELKIIEKGLFPILNSSDARLLCVTLYSQSPELVVYDISEWPFKKIAAYDSFETFVEFQVYCYEHHISIFDEVKGKKYLSVDLDKLSLAEKEYKRLNPKTGRLKRLF